MQGEASGATAVHDRPACVVLGVREGHTPSDKPPVRIFLGTEARQFRAERIFIWSIERHRDPARVYEIYLMKDIRGFRRHGWLTGFTNYRFAIPHFAGNKGRAIYNDVDQIYLKDPALLFDTNMEVHGYLSIHDCDTSVMLIDCERMSSIWTLETAQNEKRRVLDDRARLTPGLWGQLDPGWNARDIEYHPDTSHLVHFTTIHTQPWRPFPREYVYGQNPVGELWFGYEREADEAGFLSFTAHNPSPEFAGKLGAWQNRICTTQIDHSPAVNLLQATGQHDAVYSGPNPPRIPNLHLDHLEPARLSDTVIKTSDAVVCADFLEHMPDSDILWLLDGLFARTGKTLSLLVTPHRAAIPGAHRRDPQWWYAQVSATAVRYPHVHWQLVVKPSKRRTARWEGGAPLNWPPRVWVLAHYKAGHHHQAQDIADALGWPYEKHELATSKLKPILALLADRLFGKAWGMPIIFLPPWPDLVIASGWLPAKIARWVGRRSGGRTRLVLMGRKAGPAEESEDILVSCAHFRLTHHPRRIQTLLPVHKGDAATQPDNTDTINNKPSPTSQVALLVGGTSRYYSLNTDTARRMARQVLEFASSHGAALNVITSRRTGDAVEHTIAEELKDKAQLYFWRLGARRKDFQLVLNLADSLIVTGESESMLTEAVITGKPVYIYALPRRRSGPLRLFAHWIEHQAATPRYNRRNTIRPQEGLRYFCARLIERGWVLPPRAVEPMHNDLINQRLAYNFITQTTYHECKSADNVPKPDLEVAIIIAELLQWHIYMSKDQRQRNLYKTNTQSLNPCPKNTINPIHALTDR